MASRYLLIEFDDEATATRLREQIDNASRAGKAFRVVGLFAKPGPNFCRCGTWTTDRGNVSSLKYGRKFGWQVCKTCRRPAPIISFLKNLIQADEIINPSTHDSLDGRHKLTFYPMGMSAPTKGI